MARVSCSVAILTFSTTTHNATELLSQRSGLMQQTAFHTMEYVLDKNFIVASNSEYAAECYYYYWDYIVYYYYYY